MRLRSDFWVSAYIRRVEGEGSVAMLRRRGAAEAGAIFIKVDRLDGQAAFYAPAPQSLMQEDDGVRRWHRTHDAETIDAADVEARIVKELKFDPDLWIIEVEDRAGRHFLDLG